jgi:hypothetical protein
MDPGPAPTEVRTEHTPQGVRFVFPPRAEARGIGALVGILVVLAGVSAPGVCLWSWVFTSAAEDRGLALALAILVTPLLYLLLAVLTVAAYGHSEIAVEGKQLVARERAGLLSSSRRRPLRRLSRLELTTRTFWLGGHNGGQESRVRNQFELRYALRAHFGLYDSIVLAYGYPRDMLHNVAGALREFAAGPGATAAPQPEEAATGRARIEIAFDQDREPPRPDARYVRVSGDGNTPRFDFPPSGGLGCAILVGAIFAGVPGDSRRALDLDPRCAAPRGLARARVSRSVLAFRVDGYCRQRGGAQAAERVARSHRRDHTGLGAGLYQDISVAMAARRVGGRPQRPGLRRGELAATGPGQRPEGAPVREHPRP